MGVYFQEENNVILYHGDALEVLKHLPEGFVDLIITSPPYNVGKEYGDNVNDTKSYEEYLEFARYTRQGEWVLDPFVGSGTTLIECKRLGRNGIGIELNQKVAEEARKAICRELNFYDVVVDVVVGDAKKVNYDELLEKYGINKVQLVILHPPYWDVIKFSNDPEDLSAAKSLEEFLKLFKEVVEKVSEVLEEGRYLGLVIGDKYSGGEWIPLGFYCMEEVMDVGYRLKGIVVKSIGETRLSDGSSRGL